MHQHLQPRGADRRRPRGPQGARAGPQFQALGEDQPRAGLARWSPIISTKRASPKTSTRSASIWSAMAAPPASAIRGRCPKPISASIHKNDLVAASVLSGNRNFEGRVSPRRARQLSRLAAPGRRLCDQGHGDRGHGRRPRSARGQDGVDVYLKDIWPSNEEVRSFIDSFVNGDMFRARYGNVYEGDDALARHPGDGRRHLCLAGRLDLHRQPALFRGDDDDADRRRATSSTRGRWRSSAIRSPPITSARPARSSSTAPAASSSPSMASPAPTSTATARGAAITT